MCYKLEEKIINFILDRKSKEASLGMLTKKYGNKRKVIKACYFLRKIGLLLPHETSGKGIYQIGNFPEKIVEALTDYKSFAKKYRK